MRLGAPSMASHNCFSAPLPPVRMTRFLSSIPEKHSVSIWELNETYKVKIVTAKNVNVYENQKVYVRASIYHGSEPVCSSMVTAIGANSEATEWNEILEFNIPVNEIPRAAKLCFVVFGATDATMRKYVPVYFIYHI